MTAPLGVILGLLVVAALALLLVYALAFAVGCVLTLFGPRALRAAERDLDRELAALLGRPAVGGRGRL